MHASAPTIDGATPGPLTRGYRAKAQGKGRYHVFRETDPEARAARDQTWVERGPTVRRREPLRVTDPRRTEPRLEPSAG